MAFTTCRPIFFYNNCHGYRTENYFPISIFTSFELGTCIRRTPPLYQSRYRLFESFQNIYLLIYHSILVCSLSLFNLMIFFLTFRKILYCKLNQLQCDLCTFDPLLYHEKGETLITIKNGR